MGVYLQHLLDAVLLCCRFDDAALGRLEAAAFDTAVHQGIELPQVRRMRHCKLPCSTAQAWSSHGVHAYLHFCVLATT